jgi:hypothetical protein
MRRIVSPSWLGLLLALLFSVSCEDEPATKVVVEIDAEESVKELVASVHLVIEGGGDIDELEGRSTRYDNELDREFPKFAELTPLTGDNARAFVLTATALDEDGRFVAAARIISSYVPGQTRRPKLLIQGGSCLRKECGGDRDTCSNGGCVDSTVDPTHLGNGVVVDFPDGGDDSDADIDADLDAETDADLDAETDSEVDAGPDAGPPDAGPDAADAGPSIGDKCPGQNGQFHCLGTNSIGVMACAGGVWQQWASCNAVTQRCDSRAGNTQGSCLDVVSECADKMPGDQACRGNQRLMCGADRVSVETVDCPSGQVCVQQGRETSCMTDAVDECDLNTDDCDDDPLNVCRNELAGFSCVCPTGYTGNGRGASGCAETDECAQGADKACGAAGAACMNSPGSYTCTCPAGYTGTGGKTCTNINECANGTVAACGMGATGCADSAGSYQCTCGAGYNGTGSKACTVAGLTCASGAAMACGVSTAICTMAGSSYTCTCPVGYTGTGSTHCSETDECLAGSLAACGVAGAGCSNTPLGSHTCTTCPSGYSGAGGTRCNDINECLQSTTTALCGVGAATCNNTAGSYTCTCPSGYNGTGTRMCTAIPALGPRPQCMVWMNQSRGDAAPTGAILGGFELTYASYPGPADTNRHWVCQINSGGVQYPGKLSENANNGRTWGCYAHTGSSLLDAASYGTLTLASGCTTSWVSAGSSMPTNAVVAGMNGSALLVPCMAHVSTATPSPFPLPSNDPASAHPNDTHLGWVSSAGPYQCRYEFFRQGYAASTFQILVWNQ